MAATLARIDSIILGDKNMSSLIILRPVSGRESHRTLPIRVGRVEAASISSGLFERKGGRPSPHDLMIEMIKELGADVECVLINRVEGTVFHALVRMKDKDGVTVSVDARPSDALALAIRLHRPIFVEPKVIEAASTPDFVDVDNDTDEPLVESNMTEEQKEEFDEFRKFLDSVEPEDFGKYL